MTPLNTLLLVFALTSTQNLALADDNTAIEKFSIYGQKESLPTKPGSAFLLDSTELEKLDYSDIHRVLKSVPGVNVQEEDGFGLRPNIGLRGAHPHRSKKITLMEDEVLLGPAPYSAPAMYFFPMLDHIDSIEVFKGATSVNYGPNSIGGAINMVSKSHAHGAKLQAEYGSFNFQKYLAEIGIETFGDFSITLARASHNGFKELDNNDNTGFARNTVNLRWDKVLAPYEQNITFKAGWTNESSNETYLGLTQADFDKNPFHRYDASQLDKMNWEHKRLFLSYALSPINDLRVRTTAYYNDFDRNWEKFDGFNDRSIKARDVLLDPTASANSSFYQIISGKSDSSTPGTDEIRLTSNDRKSQSLGLQTRMSYNTMLNDEISNTTTLGYRYHEDEIASKNLSTFYLMRSGNLASSTITKEELRDNKASASAQTINLYNETEWNNLFAYFGVRAEFINYKKENFLSNKVQDSKEEVLAPGAGVFYKLTDNGGFLAGVHKGVTPVGPGQKSNIKSEEALNFELGYRYSGSIGLEFIGFYSDYENVLGTCTLSTGCSSTDLDTQYNGGEAEIKGAELLLTKDFKSGELTFPIRLNLTWTDAKFKTGFSSTLADWGVGNVKSGDPMPYIPEWQANLNLGLKSKIWKTFISLQYVGEMADQAVEIGRQTINEQFIVDASFHYKVNTALGVFVKANNLLNNKFTVSQRPFGLRPGKPQSFFLGLKYDI